MKLFETALLGKLKLNNRIVMAPLTRSRAPSHLPNDLMVQYYSQRATAGLIITEGTSPSPNGLGYARIPGLYNEEQSRGWKTITQGLMSIPQAIAMRLQKSAAKDAAVYEVGSGIYAFEAPFSAREISRQ